MGLLPYIVRYEVTGLLDSCRLASVTFETGQDLSAKEARDFARKRIKRGHTFTHLEVSCHRLTETKEEPFKRIRYF